jgi:zinc protease
MNGTKTRDALEIAQALEERGASLGFGANREGVNIGGYSLAADLPILIETFADVVQNATFPTDKLELTRQQTLTSLKWSWIRHRLARRTFQQPFTRRIIPYHAFPNGG